MHRQHLCVRVGSLFVRAPVSHQGSERGCRSRKPRRQPARTVGWRLAPDLRPRLSPKPLCPTSAQTPDLCFDALRSEEHTSELQSLMRISYAVFCLKKKKTRTTQP